MPDRFVRFVVPALLSALLVVAVAAFAWGRESAPAPALAAQAGGGTWNSTMIWRPTLEEAGLALAEWVNQIDAACQVDVDNVTAINGSGPEGDVYAFAVTWSC
jgi:hypothetical protein